MLRKTTRFGHHGTAWALLLVLLAGACGAGSEEQEPGVEALSTDLSYGIENEEQAAPANTGARESGPVPTPTVDEPPAPTFNPFVIPEPTGEGGGGEGAPRCPEAPPSESPDRDATFEVEGLPKAGFYLWAVDGGELVDSGGRLVRVAFSDFIRREVQGVKGESGNFQYQIEEQELTAGNADQITTTYEVDSGGVFLSRIERRRDTKDGEEVSVFDPTPSVTYLPTPVSVGSENSFSSRGVDLTSSAEPQVLEHEGFVKGKRTIDACGEEIRAWIVESKQTYRIGTEEVERDFTYGIATQAGALFVFEDVRTCDGRDAEGKCQPAETTDDGEKRYRVDYEARIGQLEPDEE